MKLTVQIECDSIQAFQAHLLDMFQKTIIHLHEQSKLENGLSDVDEFNADVINTTSLLDDDNCYGSRSVFIVNEF